MTTSSPESNRITPETNAYPVSYSDFADKHPVINTIVENVRDIRHIRSAYGANPNNAPGNYADWPKQSDIDGYLGAGYEKSAYLVDDGFVIKIQNRHSDTDESFITDPNNQIQALMKGTGVDGLEQIVTADPESGILVTKLAKGRPITEIPSQELLRIISSDHIAKLKKTLAYMSANLLEFDNPHNVLFDSELGFTIIDYRTPLGLKPDETYSTDPDDENYSGIYVNFIERHSLSSALDELLASKKKASQGIFNAHGELETYLKPTIGRRVVRSLVRLKK